MEYLLPDTYEAMGAAEYAGLWASCMCVVVLAVGVAVVLPVVLAIVVGAVGKLHVRGLR